MYFVILTVLPMRPFILLAFLITGVCQAQYHRITEPARWVENIPMDGLFVKDTACSRGGTEYLLSDRQFHLGEQRAYFRLVTRLTSSEGVQNGSRIDVDIDPSYQKLELHTARIIRDGHSIDQLDAARINVLQRERDLNAFLYDGTRSVVLEMEDVRQGDIIEQAFTIVGNDAAGDGRFHRKVPMGYQVPLAHQYLRFIIPKGRSLQFKGHLFNEPATITNGPMGEEHVWRRNDIPCILEETGTPGWYTSYPQLQVSEFKDLEDLRQWAIAQYAVDMRLNAELERVVSELSELSDPFDRIDSAIHIVQRKVRYLGLEDGISAYRPRPPAKVYTQRFGDCKDRSLLLVALLREMGVKAWPALVHTTQGRAVADELPRPGSFNHCIALIEHDGEQFWVDPTMSHNRGNLKERYTPDMGNALIVDPSFTGWTPMRTDPMGTVEITETFTLDSIGGGAILEVESRYTRREADNIRSYFASQSNRSISEQYRDFYLARYGDGIILDPVSTTDDVSANLFISRERYQFHEIWDSADDGSSYLSFNAAVLKDLVDMPSLRNRTSPYATSHPIEVTQRMIVNMPEDWPLYIDPVDIEGYGVRYSSRVVNDGPRVEMTYRYRSDSTMILPEDMPAYYAQQQQILNDLDIYLTHTPPDTSFAALELMKAYGPLLMIFAMCIWGCMRIYQWDPEPHSHAIGSIGTSIGGWMVLPMIGLLLTPFILLRDILSDDAWILNAGLYDPIDGIRSKAVYFLYIQMTQIHALGALCLTIVTAILFFGRRSSVPTLMKAIYLMTVVFTLIDMGLYEWLHIEALTGEAYGTRDIGRAIFAAMIWVPFFHLSRRVHTTFVKRHNGRPEDHHTIRSEQRVEPPMMMQH